LPTLAAGRADSAVLGEPGVAGAESQGMKYLFNLEQSTVPGSAAFVYIALKSYVTEHPDVTKAFADTILKSHVEANKDPDLVRELAKTSTDIDPALLAKVTLPTFGENAVQPKEIDTWIGLLEQYGELDKSKAPAASDVLGL
jgi:NitT/TauT family transport system substrate-binding protein